MSKEIPATMCPCCGMGVEGKGVERMREATLIALDSPSFWVRAGAIVRLVEQDLIREGFDKLEALARKDPEPLIRSLARTLLEEVT